MMSRSKTNLKRNVECLGLVKRKTLVAFSQTIRVYHSPPLDVELSIFSRPSQRPSLEFPNLEFQKRDFPNLEFHKREFPNLEFHKREFPNLDPNLEFHKREFSNFEFPKREFSNLEFPKREFSNLEFPNLEFLILGKQNLEFQCIRLTLTILVPLWFIIIPLVFFYSIIFRFP